MAKKKRGGKKKRVAAHIRENQVKRAAAAESGDGEVGADTRAPMLAAALGVGKPKRPRESAATPPAGCAGQADAVRRETERIDASNYLAAWLSIRKAKEAAEAAGLAPPAPKGVWKFNKNTQAWLLRNAFLDDQIGEKSFGTLCLYLEGLKGAGRERILAAAQEIIDKHGPDEGAEQTAAAREAAGTATASEATTPAADEAAAAAAKAPPSAVGGYGNDSSDDGEEEDEGGGGGGGGNGAAEAREARKKRRGEEAASGSGDGGGGGGGEFAFSFFDGSDAKTSAADKPPKGAGVIAQKQPGSDSGSDSGSEDSRESSGSDDSDDDHDNGSALGRKNGAGGGRGAVEAAAPPTKKPRKPRSALTGQSKAAAKAKAAAVAYERALQVAEVLA